MFHFPYPTVTDIMKTSAPKSALLDLIGLILPASERAGLMLMLVAPFDDAGTHDGSDMVVWGGFFGTAEQWANFDRAWLAKLTRPLPGKAHLTKFGLADCERHRGDFVGYSAAESDLLQNECRELIVQAGVMGLAYAVERAEWDRLVKGPARDFFGDAESICFSACFNGAIERARLLFPEDRMLSLHFDLGRKSPKLDALIDRVRKSYMGSPAIINISFNRVAQFLPLQAADIIATENYWHANGVLTGNANPRPHFAHFLQRVRADGYLMQEPQDSQYPEDVRLLALVAFLQFRKPLIAHPNAEPSVSNSMGGIRATSAAVWMVSHRWADSLKVANSNGSNSVGVAAFGDPCGLNSAQGSRAPSA